MLWQRNACKLRILNPQLQLWNERTKHSNEFCFILVRMLQLQQLGARRRSRGCWNSVLINKWEWNIEMMKHFLSDCEWELCFVCCLDLVDIRQLTKMQDRLDSGFNNRSGPVITSPYLNFDPSILNPVSEVWKSTFQGLDLLIELFVSFKSGSNFIIPEGQGEQRSKMELSFFTMGTAVCAGGLFGGVSGLLLGRKETSGLKGKVRYSQ